MKAHQLSNITTFNQFYFAFQSKSTLSPKIMRFSTGNSYAKSNSQQLKANNWFANTFIFRSIRAQLFPSVFTNGSPTSFVQFDIALRYAVAIVVRHFGNLVPPALKSVLYQPLADELFESCFCLHPSRSVPGSLHVEVAGGVVWIWSIR